MMCHRLVLTLLLVVGGTTLPIHSQQPTPDLSGRWFIDKARVKPTAIRPFWPVCQWECSIVQTPTHLTVTEAAGQDRTFRIGARPVTETREAFGHSTTQTTSVQWEREWLVIAVITGSFSTTTRLSVDGDRLIVSTTRSGRGGGAAQDTVAYSRKR
jgi:hypothetical protein